MIRGGAAGVVGLRPFVPAQEYGRAAAFYKALGFTASHADSQVTLLTMDGFTFILQNFYVAEHAANTMVQLLVRDADAWWAAHRVEAVAAEFETRAPIPPAMQHWGLRVGFVFDPSGILWHIAELPADQPAVT